MEGVDLLDANLDNYRTKLRSKKYYLRLVLHLLDLVVVNSWLHYQRDCDSLEVLRQKQKNQFSFKLALANYLCKYQKIATGSKRGRLFSIQLNYENQKKKGPTKPIRDADKRRQDQIGHMPVVMGKQTKMQKKFKLLCSISCMKTHF